MNSMCRVFSCGVEVRGVAVTHVSYMFGMLSIYSCIET